jgi:hypothetical protein
MSIKFLSLFTEISDKKKIKLKIRIFFILKNRNEDKKIVFILKIKDELYHEVTKNKNYDIMIPGGGPFFLSPKN